MKKNRKKKIKKTFERISGKVTQATGRPATFITACILIIVWLVSGPIFNYSDTWQLIINTGTTIITFLMVFIIQQSQNKDTIALQMKLNELIACTKGASNRLIDIEDLSEDEILTLKKFYVQLAKLAQKEIDLRSTHSLDSANDYHIVKKAHIKDSRKNKPASHKDEVK